MEWHSVCTTGLICTCQRRDWRSEPVSEAATSGGGANVLCDGACEAHPRSWLLSCWPCILRRGQVRSRRVVRPHCVTVRFSTPQHRPRGAHQEVSPLRAQVSPCQIILFEQHVQSRPESSAGSAHRPPRSAGAAGAAPGCELPTPSFSRDIRLTIAAVPRSGQRS